MEQFSITRSGVIPRMETGDHYCGLRDTQENLYTVSITVTGALIPPDFFTIENSEIHDWVVSHFTREDVSRSCERMALEITSCVLDRMAAFPQWTVETIHSEVIGSNNAKIAHTWKRDTPAIADTSIDPDVARIINGYARVRGFGKVL